MTRLVVIDTKEILYRVFVGRKLIVTARGKEHLDAAGVEQLRMEPESVVEGLKEQAE